MSGAVGVDVLHGDCLTVMADMPAESVDAIVTDPPYGLGFMGKAWDHLPPGQDWAEACLRVLKPGGHLIAFGGSRTWHRLAVAVEDGGFEIRDSIAWLYGSGFPKSLDVSKAIDKAAGAERETKGWLTRDRVGVFAGDGGDTTATSGNLQCPDCLKWKFAPDYCKCPRDNGAQTDDAERWQGWGTALKPAFEPIVVSRKPLTGTVAGNVLEWGTGALNIDACRVGWQSDADKAAGRPASFARAHDGFGDAFAIADRSHRDPAAEQNAAGRWPANVVLDEHTAPLLDAQSGNRPGMATQQDLRTTDSAYFGAHKHPGVREGYNDSGGASRFFYTAKASKRERPVVDGTAHPTVKPLALMRWLVRLVTPPGGTILDPFAGSGTTLEAAMLEGFHATGIEAEADYLPLIRARLARHDGTLDWTTPHDHR